MLAQRRSWSIIRWSSFPNRKDLQGHETRSEYLEEETKQWGGEASEEQRLMGNLSTWETRGRKQKTEESAFDVESQELLEILIGCDHGTLQ